jgi:Initiator Replication protein
MNLEFLVITLKTFINLKTLEKQMVQINYILNKSNRAINISNNLTFVQRKIFNTILIAIQHNPNELLTKIDVNQFNSILKSTARTRNKIKLINVLDALMTKVINLITPSETKFSNCTYLASHKLEDGIITIQMSEALKQQIILNYLDTSAKEYTKLDTRIINSLQSTHSIALYEYIKFRSQQFKFKGIDCLVSNLRDITCSNTPFYNDFNSFKYNVLKHSIDEINAKTDIKITSFNTIKNELYDAKKIYKVNFSIEKQEAAALKGYEPKSKTEIITHYAITDSGIVETKEINEISTIEKQKIQKVECTPQVEIKAQESHKIIKDNEYNPEGFINDPVVKELKDLGITHDVIVSMYKKDEHRLKAIYSEVMTTYAGKGKTSKDFQRIIVSMFNKGVNPNFKSTTDIHEEKKKENAIAENQAVIKATEQAALEKTKQISSSFNDVLTKFKTLTNDTQDKIFNSFFFKNKRYQGKDANSILNDSMYSSIFAAFIVQEKLI